MADFFDDCMAQNDFFGDCKAQDEMFDWEIFGPDFITDDFFTDCDRMTDEDIQAISNRLAKEKRILANAPRAEWIRKLLERVRNYDYWKDAVLDNEHEWYKYDDVKARHNRKDKLMWILESMYYLLAFDYKKWPDMHRKNYTFSKLAKRYDRNWKLYWVRKEQAQDQPKQDELKQLKSGGTQKAMLDAANDMRVNRPSLIDDEDF